MLVICVGCGKIIGCNVIKGIIRNSCITCEDYESCRNAIPPNSQAKVEVLFVHFKNGCLDHDRILIGFSRN